jgi:hypothetical protein
MKVFVAAPNSPFVDASMLQWKYWEKRDDWVGPRSYLFERDGYVLAHVGLWPVSVIGNNGEYLQGVQMIDWAAAKEAPGAGIAIVQRLSRMFSFIYSIGGSEITQRALPAFGFRQRTKAWRGVRSLSPLRQMFTHPSRNWKLMPRLARNSFWYLYPIIRTHNWNATAIQPAEIPEDLVSSFAKMKTFFPRQIAFFEYLFRCPGAKFQLYLVLEAGEPKGLLLLSMVRLQLRIAGIWLKHSSLEAWRSVYALAQKAAVRFSGVCEIIAQGTGDINRDAAVSSGLRISSGVPVYILDREEKIGELPEFQLCDDDSAFLDSGESSYWS